MVQINNIGRIIKSFTDNTSDSNVIPNFKDPLTHDTIPTRDLPDFLNSFFVDIADRLGIVNPATPLYDNRLNIIGDVNVSLAFENDLPEQNEVLLYAKEIDLSISSSVLGISTKFCVHLIKSIPNVVCRIFKTSMLTGIFPRVWSNGIVTLLPKPGDLSGPGNWRPITQTSVFA